MYIPSLQRHSAYLDSPHSAPISTTSTDQPLSVGYHVVPTELRCGNAMAVIERALSTSRGLCRTLKQDTGKEHSHILAKRQSSQSTNITIGVVVAVSLTLFMIAVVYFCHRYRGSIRFRGHKKRRHRRRRHGSKSSKSVRSGSDSTPPTPAAAVPGPSEPPPGAGG